MAAPARGFGAWLMLGFALSLASPVHAELPSSEANAELRRSRAKVEYERGSELYEAGRFQEAVQAFMAADRLAPSAPLSFNIARTYERAGDVSGALRWYRDYLRRSPNAKNAGEVRDRVAQLARRLAQTGVQQLSVLTMPPGALVVVDGRAIGTTPFTGDLPLGKHRVLVSLEGYRDASREITLEAATPDELSETLEQKITAQAAAPPRSDSSVREGDRRFGALPWVLSGAGVASLGGALGFELARRQDERRARDAEVQLEAKSQSDAMRRDQTVARVLGGLGGALLLSGGVLLLLNEREPRAPRLALGCTVSGCTATARGSF
jgi:tetratricopeptide (TPR) repeat protein